MEKREKPIIIIEHLEDVLGIWIFLEYRHSSLIYGKEYLWFTNVPNKYHGILERYGRVYEDSVLNMVGKSIGVDEVLVLDLQAEEILTYNDLLRFKYIVVGGILGDHPPRGRTKEFITSRLRNVEARNIGDGQYSIDGSIYYVNYLWLNKSMENYRFIDGLEIDTLHGSIYLPYRYPLAGDKPLIAPGLVEYLRGLGLPREILQEIYPNRS